MLYFLSVIISYPLSIPSFPSFSLLWFQHLIYPKYSLLIVSLSPQVVSCLFFFKNYPFHSYCVLYHFCCPHHFPIFLFTLLFSHHSIFCFFLTQLSQVFCSCPSLAASAYFCSPISLLYSI